MPSRWRTLLALPLLFCVASAQEMHDHPAPEKLGSVSFPISCASALQESFNRAVALLHSFAYTSAASAFQEVADHDPKCAMAHWGIAMTYFHQLWEPPLPTATVPIAQKEIRRAEQIGTASDRERQFIHALSLIYPTDTTIPYSIRVANYTQAMGELAASDRDNIESHVFYALSLLAAESPADKTHANQRQAAALLEPLYRTHPQHPGIPHYLIHAYDNAELAPKGLQAAREYSQIAPSAPHALHMPSHIFTRLGLWDDSIASNLAACAAAREQGDTGEELHAMDYLVYAYLQTGRDQQAAQVIQQLSAIPNRNAADFKIAYAATAMPIRYAVERNQWADAAQTDPPTAAPPHVIAIAIWARGMGLAHTGRAAETHIEIEHLQQIEDQLRAAGNPYWAAQTGILRQEVMAWSAQASGKPDQAAMLLRAAADQEDAVEKLPVTPGPIVPAREQLAELLLEQNHPAEALKEFQTSLTSAPGRRASQRGAAQAAKLAARN